jgi:UDP-N-acetylglucosamine 1-carboxyvinyltransferase
MCSYLVKKSPPLSGAIDVSTSKNSMLPILAACLLTSEEVVLQKVPDLTDVRIMMELLQSIGAKVELSGEDLRVDCGDITSREAPDELVQKMRASFLLMGPLLARFGRARVPLPGGCDIGTRPVDLHLKGFHAMGSAIKTCQGSLVAEGATLKGTTVYLDYPSVGSSENIIMAASLAEGETVIINAAREPEIVDLANFINAMGGKVQGAGTDMIRIRGMARLRGCTYMPISDRIEAGTLMVAAALTGGDLTLNRAVPEHLRPISAKLRESGADVWEESGAIRVRGSWRPQAVDIKTMPWPGFPTDLQPQAMVLCALSKGVSVITETVFENRFMHVSELNRMGAEIRIKERNAIIEGVGRLYGSWVKATDLRAGAALVLAGLVADGETRVLNSDYIDRGYENLAEKLRSVGGLVEAVST